MKDIYEEDGPIHFCQLSVSAIDSDGSMMIDLWFHRIVGYGEYRHHEDYTVGCDIWSACLTNMEREWLERYLWENNITDFSLECHKNGAIEGLIGMGKNHG